MCRVRCLPCLLDATVYPFSGSSNGCFQLRFHILKGCMQTLFLLVVSQNCSSAFGAFLDPVADKLMVAAVLVLLSTQPITAGPMAGNAWLLPVLTLGKSHSVTWT